MSAIAAGRKALCVLLLMTMPLIMYAQQAPELILAGCEYDYPPYSIVNPDNSVTGFSVELLRAALKAMGRSAIFKTGTWSEMKQDLTDGTIKVLPQVGRTPEREAIFDFTFPYLVMHGTIVVRNETEGILVPGDLAGKIVAVLKDDNAEEYLLRAKLGAKIVALDSFEKAIRGVSESRYDAVVIQKLVAMQIIQQNGFKNLKTVGPPLTDFKQSFCFATRKGDKELLAILNEGLSIVMADGTFRELYATWFSGIETLNYVNSQIIVGGDYNNPPYEYLDNNGQPTGFNVDLTKAIAAQLSLDVEIRLGPWNEIRKGLTSGTIDVVQGMFYSAERDSVYSFSPEYSVVNHVIAGRSDLPVPEFLQDLAGKSVIVMAGDVMEDLATKMGFGQDLVRVTSQEEGLLLLASGVHDFALVAQIPALYSINKNKLRNIRLSKAPILAAEYCYAAPNDSGTLVAQFSQGLAAVLASGEFRKIERKWLAPYETKGGFLVLARYTAIIVLTLLILLFIVFLWSWFLRKSVHQKTRQLSVEITERAKAEAEVKLLNQDLEGRVSERTAQLEAVIKELEAFSYAVSHDLRAPLRATEGFSTILEEQYKEVLDDKGRDYLKRIRDASTKMGLLIEDLLGLSRVNRFPLVRKDIDLSKLANDTVKQIMVSSRPNPYPEFVIEPGMRVTADPSLTEILLRNLLENAVKYSAKAVAPKIEVGSTRRDDDTSGETVFWVKDNGVGFDMAYAGELFAPFQRLHSVKEFTGTGIGLVTVHRIVTRHGGRVWPEAEPGKGACFYFTLGRP